tara:strand:+ start:14563 stop:14943 length:381 start_codon:yes stop_codon:yes gene_type:complete
MLHAVFALIILKKFVTTILLANTIHTHTFAEFAARWTFMMAAVYMAVTPIYYAAVLLTIFHTIVLKKNITFLVSASIVGVADSSILRGPIFTGRNDFSASFEDLKNGRTLFGRSISHVADFTLIHR